MLLLNALGPAEMRDVCGHLAVLLLLLRLHSCLQPSRNQLHTQTEISLQTGEWNGEPLWLHRRQDSVPAKTAECLHTRLQRSDHNVDLVKCVVSM